MVGKLYQMVTRKQVEDAEKLLEKNEDFLQKSLDDLDTIMKKQKRCKKKLNILFDIEENYNFHPKSRAFKTLQRKKNKIKQMFYHQDILIDENRGYYFSIVYEMEDLQKKISFYELW